MQKRTRSSSSGGSAGKRSDQQLPKLERKKFESALEKLHVELVKLQLWVKHKGLKVVIIFEGRDAAGKEEAASLDRISNGRLVLGIGAGWNVEEMRNHGTPFESRWEILRERVLAMREIWTKDRYLYPSHRERKTSGEHNGIGEAGDRRPLAPSRLPALLALAVEAWAAISRSRGS